MCFVFKSIWNGSQSLFTLLCMFMYTIQFSSYCEYFACKWGKFDFPYFFPACNAQTTCDSIVWNNVISNIINWLWFVKASKGILNWLEFAVHSTGYLYTVWLGRWICSTFDTFILQSRFYNIYIIIFDAGNNMYFEWN